MTEKNIKCRKCKENNWKASEEIVKDDDIGMIYLVCQKCGNIWTAVLQI